MNFSNIPKILITHQTAKVIMNVIVSKVSSQLQ